MKNGQRILVGAVSATLLSCGSAATAQSINSWTNPASGDWHDLKWTLGTRPSTNQTVLITNAGWKAVSISPSTVAAHPETLTVSNLTVSAPTDSMNTLFLNYAGVSNPLRVLGDLVVGTNGAVGIASSSLWLAQPLGQRLLITNGSVSVNAGALSATNGETVIAGGQLNLADSESSFSLMSVGMFAPSTVNQLNGTNRFTTLSIGTFDLWSGLGATSGNYNVTNGTLLGGTIVVGNSGDGTFVQTGGRVAAGSLTIALGHSSGSEYRLHGGELTVNSLILGAYSGQGSFTQLGGTNRTSELRLGQSASPQYYPQGNTYALSNGLLAAGSATIGPVYDTSRFTQAGGTFVVTNQLTLSGASGTHSIHESYRSYFAMAAGSCSVGGLQLNELSIFTQTGGSFSVGGAANFNGYPHLDGPRTFVSISGGSFSCSQLISYRAELALSGAALFVWETLSFTGDSYYCPCVPPGGYATFLITNSTVTASNIVVGARMRISNPTPYLLTNAGTFFLSGFIFAGDCTENLGRLISAGGTIDMFEGNAKLAFANSSAEVWAGELTVANWSGFTNGGGADQLRFGTDAGGLTAAQLGQIKFVNPVGFSAGTYNARILSTGEVVPSYQSIIYPGVVGNSIVLSWSNATALQTATNVAGPYFEVPGATSPYTNPATEKQRFFRLRQ